MKARTSILAAAASAGAMLLQPTASFGGQTVSGPLYEDTTFCDGGTNFCSGDFTPYPNLPGKYIRLNMLTCDLQSTYPVNKITIYNFGGGISLRSQYVDAPLRSGSFTFSQPIDFVVAALPTRRLQVYMNNTGGGAIGNNLDGNCTVSGLIFTP